MMFSKWIKYSTVIASVGLCDAYARVRIGRFTGCSNFCIYAESKPPVNIADFRKEYSQKGLIESEVSSNPFDQFKKWFDEACNSNVLEPNAMCLSTCRDNKPSARIVLLKGFDEKGFIWYTNYNSRKGSELEINPNAALTFWWGDLERSVRIEGEVEMVEPELSDEYFNSRPRSSRIGAWTSNQSKSISGREELERQEKDISDMFKDKEIIPRPEHWGGYRLRPNRIEFWKGRQSRLHDRIVFTKENLEQSSGWKMERLQP